MRKFVMLFLLTLPALAQNQMTVTASKIPDSAGIALALGQACFLPTLNNGTPTSYNFPCGTAQKRTVCTSVTAGAFSISLPNVLGESFEYLPKLTVKDRSSGQTVVDLGDECCSLRRARTA